MSSPSFEGTGVEALQVLLPDGTKLGLDKLRENDHIVNVQQGVRLVVAAKGDAGVSVKHRWNGDDLPEKAVRNLKSSEGPRWEVRELFRGRNELVVEVEGFDEPFVLPLFYKSGMVEWLESIVKALILVVVVKTFVVQAFFIPTGSMQNTLFPSDYILVEKVTGLFHPPKVGDIIVFQYPEDPTKDFIKRMVADEGDVLEMRYKQLVVDGECADEPYAVHGDTHVIHLPGMGGEMSRRDHWGPLEIPEDHSFAMGDNRDFSMDSRFWGPLPDFRLKGRALALYYPFRRMGWIRPAVRTSQGPCGEDAAAASEDYPEVTPPPWLRADP